MIRTMQKILDPVRRRLAQMVCRALVSLADDAPGFQELQAKVLAGEVLDRLERFQDYGFSSVPLPGAEGLFVAVGGCRSNGVLIAVGDRRYRIRDLQPGEVAIYTDEDQAEAGHRIVFRRGGIIDVHCQHLRLHARTSRTTDVAGYGETLTFTGGNAWRLDTYHEGAVVTSVEHGIQPPEVE